MRERILALVNLLTKQTIAGKISWVATDKESVYMYSGGKSSVIVNQWPDQDGDLITVVVILNERGTPVEELRSGFENSGDPWSEYEPSAWNKSLESLYRVARSNALDIDQVLDDLMAELEGK
jgi:hypothetical protein